MLNREHAELESLRAKMSPKALADVLHAVATAWQIVDIVHRVRDLAEGMPGVNKGPGSRVRAFLGATEIAERFRHYVQHLRGELSKTEVNRFPVWGSLSWVSASDGKTLHTTFMGVMRPGTEISAGVFDAQEQRYVSRVSLSVQGVHFNVDPIVVETTAFCDHILGVIDEMQPGLPPVGVLEPISTRFELYDPSVALRALPRVLPTEMVEAVEQHAAMAKTTPGALVDKAVQAWTAAGSPAAIVPLSVETACAELPEGASTLIRTAYQALAWWLRSNAEPDAAPPNPKGEASGAS